MFKIIFFFKLQNPRFYNNYNDADSSFVHILAVPNITDHPPSTTVLIIMFREAGPTISSFSLKSSSDFIFCFK